MPIMPIYKLLLTLVVAFALTGCSSKSWNWFFDDDEEDLVYEEVNPEEEMLEEEFEEELVYEDEYEAEDDEMMEKDSRRDEEPPRRGPRYRDDDDKDKKMRDRDGRRSDRQMRDDDMAELPKRTVIHFNYKKTRVAVRDIAVLEKHAQALRSDPDLVVTIEGHTDSVASVGYNKKLGLKRARMVADILEEMGVDSAQVVTVSYGEDRPLETGNSKRAHEMNRRVELIY